MAKRAFAIAALAALAASAPAAAGGAATITISHQMRGCHLWQLGGGSPKPTLSIALRSGTLLRIVNDDVMPQKLVQQSGPRVAFVHPNMNHLGAATSFRFVRRGIYRFTTEAGEDYPWMKGMATTGKDYVLHLTVRVK